MGRLASFPILARESNWWLKEVLFQECVVSSNMALYIRLSKCHSHDIQKVCFTVNTAYCSQIILTTGEKEWHLQEPSKQVLRWKSHICVGHRRPCKKQCIFGGHRIVKIITQFFFFNDEPSIVNSKTRIGPSFMMMQDISSGFLLFTLAFPQGKAKVFI